MKTNMLNRISSLIISFCLFATIGCSNEELIGEPSEPDTGESKVVLTFCATTSLTTRTQLPGSQNLQHVRDVQLYIFEGTGGDAVCVASEDVGWQDKASEAGLHTTEQKYPVRYAGFKAGTDYTFLAVGMDEASKATYGLPDAIGVNATTLQKANAVLATGKGKDDIAISELFAGSLVLAYTGSSSLTGRIDLYRRVAGVMGWFKNIPTQIGGTDVAALRIELYKAQNKSVPLLKQTPDVIMDPIGETDANKILVEIQAEGFVAGGITGKGSYVLPMIAPLAISTPGYEDEIYLKDYTLRVVLVSADDSVLLEKRIKKNDSVDSETSGGTGIIISTDAYRFPILANHFYGIGTADLPVDLDPGTGGDEIVITVNPNWDTIIDRPMVP